MSDWMPFKTSINVQSKEVKIRAGTNLTENKIHKVYELFSIAKSYRHILFEIQRLKRVVENDVIKCFENECKIKHSRHKKKF